MALYTFTSQDDFARLNRLPMPDPRTQMWDTLGREAGRSGNQNEPNFFQKKWNSIENALGTTGAAIASAARDAQQNAKTDRLLKEGSKSKQDIVKGYGYDDENAFWDAKNASEAELFKKYGYDIDDYDARWADAYQKSLKGGVSNETDEMRALKAERQAIIDRMSADDAATTRRFDEIQDRLRGQSNQNAMNIKQSNDEYKDWVDNSYASNKLKQDRGKFLGSAINTLSTATDLMGLTAGPLSNAIQGGIEGVADELEQNGLDNFSLERAGQNALTGAASGAAVGGLNRGLNSALAKRGGQLLKGGNKLTQAINNFNQNTGVGRLASTIGMGAARGAASGAVGGATGAGLSAAMNGQDVVGSALEGARRGAQQGFTTGGIMTAGNMALNKVPGVGGVLQEANRAADDFRNRYEGGEGGRLERFGNALAETADSGDSAVANFARNLPENLQNLNTKLPPIGNTIAPDNLVGQADAILNKYSALDVDRIPAESPEYGRYTAQRNSAIQDLRGSFSDNDLAFLFTKTDNPKTMALIHDAVSSPEIKQRLSNWLDQNGGQNVNLKEGDTFIKNGETFTVEKGHGADPEMLAGVSTDRKIVTELPNEQKYEIRNAMTQDTQWDGLAQENGFANYADMSQKFTQANPGVEPSTSNILDWVDGNTVSPVRNPQTDIYDTLTGGKTSTQGKLRNAAGLKLAEQYGTIDKPTAKATNPPETLQKIADAGFTKPADVERMSDAITGSNGEVSKLVSNLIETAKPINTFNGEADQTIDDFITLSIQKRGLDGINEGKAVKSQISAILQSLPSRADGSVSFSDAPSDVFKLTQLLDAEAANYEGRSGMNYGTTTPDKLRAAQVMKDLSSLFKDRLYETVDVKQALTPEVAQNLKAYAPKNKKWAEYVDNNIMKATNVKDLRSLQSPWVRARKIIDNGYMNSMTFGGRNSRLGLPTTRKGIVGNVLDATINSKPSLRVQAAALNKAADIAEQRQNVRNNASTPLEQPIDTAAPRLPQPTGPAAEAGNVVDMAYNPQTQIYDIIGRNEGLTNGRQARAEDYINNAAKEAEMPTANTSSLEQLVNPGTASATSVYNSVYGTPNATMVSSSPQTGYFPQTGDYWTDIIGGALSSAIDDGDVASFAKLYEMYQEQLANLQKQSTKEKDLSNPANWSAGDRGKLVDAQNGLSMIDSLENSYRNAVGSGSNAIQGTLRQWANNISGGNLDPSADSYVKEAHSIGAGIVKNLINLGSTEHDAARYIEYLPKLTDTAEQANQKLQKLRDAYNNVIRNLRTVYSF